jgi:hypothetical protein
LFVEEPVAETVPAKVEEPKFQPYVPPDEVRPEFTFRAIFFGGLFGILFGAVTVYVGLRAGLTVSASIPIAVLSISVLRALGKASILENNIVQTAGCADLSWFPAGICAHLSPGLHRRMAGRTLHDPAAPSAHCERARQPSLS